MYMYWRISCAFFLLGGAMGPALSVIYKKIQKGRRASYFVARYIDMLG